MNSPNGMSRQWCFPYDIGYNNNPFVIFCHVVYATLGSSKIVTFFGTVTTLAKMDSITTYGNINVDKYPYVVVEAALSFSITICGTLTPKTFNLQVTYS